MRVSKLDLSVVLLVTVCGCSEEAITLEPAAPALSPGPEDAASTDEPESQERLYAISSNVFSSEDLSERDSFLWLVEDLEPGTLTLDDAVQLPGGASIWGVPGSGVFYVVSGEEFTITKYTGDDGVLAQSGRLGLTGVGISFLQGESMAFDGPDHGYLFDLNTAQALELDLARMEIMGVIDLSDVLLPSAELTFFGEPAFRRRGAGFVGPVYGTSALFDRVAPESKLFYFDPTTGTFELEDSPCAGLVYSAAAPNGDIYFATDVYVASVFLVNGEGPEPCMVRLPAGADGLDGSRVALNDITGGATGGIIPGSDGFAYLRVLDTELYTAAADSTYLEAFSASAWRTWRVDLDDPSDPVQLEREPLAGGLKVFEVDGQAYENESSANFGSTVLVRTTGADAPVRTLEMPGVTWGLVRLH